MLGGGGLGTGGAGGSNLFGHLSTSGGSINAPTGGASAASSSAGLFSSSGTGGGSSLFSSNPTPASSGAGAASGIFGNASSGTLFGSLTAGSTATDGVTASTAPAPGGTLFGSGRPNTTTPAGALFGGGSASGSNDKGNSIFGITTGNGSSAGSTDSGGLFVTPATGNSASASQGGLFAATSKTQDPPTAGCLGGLGATPEAAKGGLLGGAAQTVSNKPEPAQGSLFGGLTTGSTDTAKPAGGLFLGGASNTAASAVGAGATVLSKPNAASGASTEAAKGAGLFKNVGDATKTATNGGLFSGGMGVSGGATAANEAVRSTLFGGANTTTSGASQPTKADSQPSGTASGASLFGPVSTGPSSNTSSLFSGAAKPASGAAAEQKGTEASADATSTAAGEQKGNSGGLFGSNSSSAVGQGGTNLFGSKPSGGSENSPSTGTTVSSTAGLSGVVVAPEEVALETMQHERMDDLLANWERRLQRKVAQFDELSQEVAAVEASLIAQSKALASIREEQRRVHRRQVFVGETIDMIERQQHDLSSLLASIESNLLAKLSPQEQRILFSTVEQSMSQRVLDIDAQMDELASAIAVTARRTQPEPVAAISHVLAVHQAALQSATQQCAKLEQCLKNLQRYVV